ncbi:Hsp20/alpha crystallin family protein [Falsibacillus pallidus]|uniref:Hsp20/alpha crystallin family protein n=1 Tax=Falsibacillus pallidus TaxID=493781 RepID=UPI003D954F04
MPQKPNDGLPPKKTQPVHFGEVMDSMNELFREKPLKGILESIDDFFSAPFPSDHNSLNVEWAETDDSVIVTSKLPGVKKEQIFINIFPQYLTLAVQDSETLAKEDQNQGTFFKKHSMQRSSRTIQLPSIVNEKNAKATYEDGLLVIKIPKLKGKRLQID